MRILKEGAYPHMLKKKELRFICTQYGFFTCLHHLWVEGKGVGMYNFKYCEIKFEFVNINLSTNEK
jgi:hypothetical protein